MNQQYIAEVRGRLSSVWWRTLPEIRPELPDKPWCELTLVEVTHWADTRKALNQLVAQSEVEVRLRPISDTAVPERGLAYERVCRQEYKQQTHGGKRSRTPHHEFGFDVAPNGAW